MAEHDTSPQAMTMPSYWSLAAAYGLVYCVFQFAIEWIADTVAGDPFDAGPAALKSVTVGVLFGLGMAWLVPRLRRRR